MIISRIKKKKKYISVKSPTALPQLAVWHRQPRAHSNDIFRHYISKWLNYLIKLNQIKPEWLGLYHGVCCAACGNNVCEWCGQKTIPFYINVHTPTCVLQPKLNTEKSTLFQWMWFNPYHIGGEACGVGIAGATLHNSNYSRRKLYRCVIVEATSVYLTWITRTIRTFSTSTNIQPIQPRFAYSSCICFSEFIIWPES